jgi:copper chaperone CopZ
MELRFDVENIRCGGCARTIEKALRASRSIRPRALS